MAQAKLLNRLLFAALPAVLAGGTANAGVRSVFNSAPPPVDEVIVIDGDPIPDACEDEWGPGYQEVLDSEYELIGCECVFGYSCDNGDGFDWDGWNNPTPPDNGGGWTGGANCESEDAAPDTCEIKTCQECEDGMDVCIQGQQKEIAKCKRGNEAKADSVCTADQGAFKSKAGCVSGLVNGAPGTSKVEGHTDISGHTVGGGAGVKIFGIEFGGGYEHNFGSTDSSSSSTTWPYMPPNHANYPSCQDLGAAIYDICDAAKQACKEGAESAGETCEQD